MYKAEARKLDEVESKLFTAALVVRQYANSDSATRAEVG